MCTKLYFICIVHFIDLMASNYVCTSSFLFCVEVEFIDMLRLLVATLWPPQNTNFIYSRISSIRICINYWKPLIKSDLFKKPDIDSSVITCTPLYILNLTLSFWFRFVYNSHTLFPLVHTLYQLLFEMCRGFLPSTSKVNVGWVCVCVCTFEPTQTRDRMFIPMKWKSNEHIQVRAVFDLR